MKTNNEAILKLKIYIERLNNMLKFLSQKNEGIVVEEYKKWVNREIVKTNNQIEKLRSE